MSRRVLPSWAAFQGGGWASRVWGAGTILRGLTRAAGAGRSPGPSPGTASPRLRASRKYRTRSARARPGRGKGRAPRRGCPPGSPGGEDDEGVILLFRVDVPGLGALVEPGEQLDGVGAVADGPVHHAEPV